MLLSGVRYSKNICLIIAFLWWELCKWEKSAIRNWTFWQGKKKKSSIVYESHNSFIICDYKTSAWTRQMVTLQLWLRRYWIWIKIRKPVILIQIQIVFLEFPQEKARTVPSKKPQLISFILLTIPHHYHIYFELHNLCSWYILKWQPATQRITHPYSIKITATGAGSTFVYLPVMFVALN
jgi:hypothetical protein